MTALPIAAVLALAAFLYIRARAARRLHHALETYAEREIARERKSLQRRDHP